MIDSVRSLITTGTPAGNGAADEKAGSWPGAATAAAFAEAVESGRLNLPLPGGGRTRERWAVLASGAITGWRSCRDERTDRIDHVHPLLRPVPLPPAKLVKLRLEHDLEAALGLVPEDVISVRGLFQRQVVGGESGHAQRVAGIGDHRHEVADPPLD